MPEQTEQGFEPLETASNTDSSSTNEQPAAPRRRRTGRRVVRGAGAAGATVELKVEEHGPLFKEPPTALPASKPVSATGRVLCGRPSDHNTFDAPDGVRTSELPVALAGEGVRVTLPPCGIASLEIRLG